MFCLFVIVAFRGWRAWFPLGTQLGIEGGGRDSSTIKGSMAIATAKAKPRCIFVSLTCPFVGRKLYQIHRLLACHPCSVAFKPTNNHKSTKAFLQHNIKPIQ
jgi:hypothetical protein